MKTKDSRALGHFGSFLLPVYFLATAALDSSEVTNAEYLKFIIATSHSAPEYMARQDVLTARLLRRLPA